MAATRYRIKKYEGVYGYDSATKRHNGKPDVCFYLTLKSAVGKKIWEKVGWASEGYTPQLAAELRAKRIRDGRHQGEIQTSRDIRADQRKVNRTLKEIKEHYFSSSQGTAIKGKKQDLCRWDHHLTFLENKTPKELSQLDIERIKKNMKEKELAPATIDHALRLLRRVVNHGAEHRLCPRLSFRIQFPKVNNIKTEFLTPEEAARLIDTLNNWPRQDVARMVKVAMFSGLRRGELFRIKREHLDFHHGLITIAGPKGGKDVTVPMSPPVRGLLEQQLGFLEDEEGRRARDTTTPPGKRRPGRIRVLCFPAHGGPAGGVYRDRPDKEGGRLPKQFRPFHGLRHHYAVFWPAPANSTLIKSGNS